MFAPTAALLLLSTALHAEYQAGLDAYSRGDYAGAMTEWREVTDGPPTAVSPGVFVEAHYAVAMLYWEGRSVAQDFGQARQWLERAAGMNHAGAQAKLGFLYTDGKGVAQDHARAFEWYSKAARQGNVDGLYNLGVSYLYGWGTAPDATLAKQYLAAASALGDEAAEVALQDLLNAPVEPNLVRDPAPEHDREQGSLLQVDPAAAEPPPPVIPEPPPPVIPEPPPPVIPEPPPPVIPEAAQPLSGIHDEAWIRAQNPAHYTIQVMALRSRESVEKLMQDYEELAPFAVFTVQKGSKPLHVLLQGNYPDIESARLGKERFPSAIQKQDALWIRRFDMVQRLLEP